MLNIRVAQSTQSSGTGTIQLDTPAANRRSFVEAFGNGASVYYVMESASGNEWEAGFGVVTAASPDTLTRNAIESSNGNALVNFASGTKRVMCAQNADALRFGAMGDIPTVDASSTDNALILNFKPPVRHLRNGMEIRLLTLSAPTAAANLTIDGIGPWPIINIHDGSPNVPGQWRGGQVLNLIPYNNQFILLGIHAKAVLDDIVLGGQSLLSGKSGTAMVLIDRKTASNSTALVFTDIPTNYDHYVFSFHHLRPVTNGVYISAQISRNNGSSFVATTNYYWQHSHIKSNNTTSTVANAADTGWGLVESIGNTSGGGFCGEMRLYGLGDGQGFKGGTIDGQYFDGSNFRRSSGGVWINDSVSAVNALRLYATSGNLADGTVALYGVRAS